MFTFWSFNLYYLYIIFTYITFTYESWKSIESLWLSQHSHWSQAVHLLASFGDLEQFWHCGSCALAVLLMLTLPSLPRTSCPSSLGFGCIYTPSAMVTWQGVFLSVIVCWQNLEVSSSNSFWKDGSLVEKYRFDCLLESSGSSGYVVWYCIDARSSGSRKSVAIFYLMVNNRWPVDFSRFCLYFFLVFVICRWRFCSVSLVVFMRDVCMNVVFGRFFCRLVDRFFGVDSFDVYGRLLAVCR